MTYVNSVMVVGSQWHACVSGDLHIETAGLDLVTPESAQVMVKGHKRGDNATLYNPTNKKKYTYRQLYLHLIENNNWFLSSRQA